MLELDYQPAYIPAVLANTCVELAWRAADLAAETPTTDNVIDVAGTMLCAEAWQVSAVERVAVRTARSRFPDHAGNSARWAYWQRVLTLSNAEPWAILAHTAGLFTSHLDLELGLAGGQWQLARRAT